MKRNVDLTKNGDFSEKSFHFDSETNILTLFRTGGNKFPWKYSDVREIHSQRDLLHNDLVLLGNKKDRVRYRAMQIAESNNCCDCCGKKLTIFNSTLTLCLCNKCAQRLEEKEGKRKLPQTMLRDYPMKTGNNYWTEYLNHKVT